MSKRAYVWILVFLLIFSSIVCSLIVKLQQLESKLEELRNPGWSVAEDTINPNATSPHGGKKDG